MTKSAPLNTIDILEMLRESAAWHAQNGRRYSASVDQYAIEEILRLRRLSSERDEMVEALKELALLADKMGALHPTRDLREVIPDPAGLSVRIRFLLSKPQEGGEI